MKKTSGPGLAGQGHRHQAHGDPGQYVQAGMPLLEVADLSTIWVDADIYQYELPWIKVGQRWR